MQDNMLEKCPNIYCQWMYLFKKISSSFRTKMIGDFVSKLCHTLKMTVLRQLMLRGSSWTWPIVLQSAFVHTHPLAPFHFPKHLWFQECFCNLGFVWALHPFYTRTLFSSVISVPRESFQQYRCFHSVSVLVFPVWWLPQRWTKSLFWWIPNQFLPVMIQMLFCWTNGLGVAFIELKNHWLHLRKVIAVILYPTVSRKAVVAMPILGKVLETRRLGA